MDTAHRIMNTVLAVWPLFVFGGGFLVILFCGIRERRSDTDE